MSRMINLVKYEVGLSKIKIFSVFESVLAGRNDRLQRSPFDAFTIHTLPNSTVLECEEWSCSWWNMIE